MALAWSRGLALGGFEPLDFQPSRGRCGIGGRDKTHSDQRQGSALEEGKVIPIWGRPELEPVPHMRSIRRELGIGKDEFLLLYAGNMGIMHSLDPILDAAALLQGAPARFLFVGDGAKRERLTRQVERKGPKAGRPWISPM